MIRLRVGDLDRFLDAQGDDEEEGESVEAVDVDQLDGGALHLHRTPLNQSQVAALREHAQEAVGVSLTVKFLKKYLKTKFFKWSFINFLVLTFPIKLSL
jgi:hypothetical protein